MNELKKQRQKIGKTQKEIAQRVGISERAYQRYELTESEPRVRLANKIAKALKTTTIKLWPD